MALNLYIQAINPAVNEILATVLLAKDSDYKDVQSMAFAIPTSSNYIATQDYLRGYYKEHMGINPVFKAIGQFIE